MATARPVEAVGEGATRFSSGDEVFGGVNYRLSMSSQLLERLADAVLAGHIVPPPIADIKLDDVPAALARNGHADGKTVITM
jgi:NADPH:quinone reductase-like Zn-dependent oxidoreductase